MQRIFVFTLLSIQPPDKKIPVARKIPFDDPEVITYVRIGSVLTQVIALKRTTKRCSTTVSPISSYSKLHSPALQCSRHHPCFVHLHPHLQSNPSFPFLIVGRPRRPASDYHRARLRPLGNIKTRTFPVFPPYIIRLHSPSPLLQQLRSTHMSIAMMDFTHFYFHFTQPLIA